MTQYTCIYHTEDSQYYIYYREQEGDTWLPYLKSFWQHKPNRTLPDKQLSFHYRTVACEVLAILEGKSYSVIKARNFPTSEGQPHA